MANFIPSKKQASDFNNGVQYVGENLAQGIQGDKVQADTINNLVENALYTQSIAENTIPLVGMHHIQFSGEPTPAEIYPNTTWTIDTDYQGRTLIGSGGDYTFGAIGGTTSHNHGTSAMGACVIVPQNQPWVEFAPASIATGWTVNRKIVGSSYSSESNGRSTTAKIIGSTDNTAVLPPYTVVNIWKRTA